MTAGHTHASERTRAVLANHRSQVNSEPANMDNNQPGPKTEDPPGDKPEEKDQQQLLAEDAEAKKELAAIDLNQQTTKTKIGLNVSELLPMNKGDRIVFFNEDQAMDGETKDEPNIEDIGNQKREWSKFIDAHMHTHGVNFEEASKAYEAQAKDGEAKVDEAEDKVADAKKKLLSGIGPGTNNGEYREIIQGVMNQLAEGSLTYEELETTLEYYRGFTTTHLHNIASVLGNRDDIMKYLEDHPESVFQGGEHDGEDSDTKSDEMSSTVDVQMTSSVTIRVPFGQKTKVEDIIDAVSTSTKINKKRLVLVHHGKHLDSAQLIVDTPIKSGDVVTVEKIKSKAVPYFIKVRNEIFRVSAQTRSGANGVLETLLAVKSDMAVHELAAKLAAKWNITAPFALFVDDMRINFDYTTTLEDTGVGDGAKVVVKMTGLVGGGTGSDGIKDSERFFDCVFCHKTCAGWGHNPQPVFNEGRCCDKCNQTEVIRARIYQIVLQHRAQHPEDEEEA